jgi:hypothetical protein
MATLTNAVETDTPLHESFENSVGPLTETWGVDFSHFGEVRFYGNQYSTAGMKEPGNDPSAGHGYGTYTIEAMLTGTTAGPAIILWPGDNRYPGQEINLAELAPDGTGRQYATVHWNDNGENNQEVRFLEGVESGVFHTYQAIWEPGKITFNVDGHLAAIVTDHVPIDYDNGGMNNTIAFLNNNDATSLIVRQVDYVPLGVTTAPATPPTDQAIDWYALAAQAQANYEATGHWFYDAPTAPSSPPQPADPPAPEAPAAPPAPPAAAPAVAIDWNALAAQAQANFEATGHWFYDDPTALSSPAQPSAPEAAEEPVDWNALAAQAQANFEATGYWFI